jgi:hypothetical protein
MINKLTEKQIVDAFAQYLPGVELALPLDPDQCLWFYYTLPELEEQLQRLAQLGKKFDKSTSDAFAWMDRVIYQRKTAWLEFGNLSNVSYVEVKK